MEAKSFNTLGLLVRKGDRYSLGKPFSALTIFFFFFYIFIINMFVKWGGFRGEDMSWELVLSPFGSPDQTQVLCQTWQQVPLPTEPSRGSPLFLRQGLM